MKYYVMTIVGILLLALSFPIKSRVIESAQSGQSVYRKAIQVPKKPDFDYAIETEQGNLITTGELASIKSVKFPEMNKAYLAVKKREQIYTQHTRTTTDSKGRTHTEIYYSWDYAGGDEVQVEYVKFKGHQYKSNLFSFSDLFEDIDADKITNTKPGVFGGRYYYASGVRRYSYEIVKNKNKVSFIANAGKNGLKPLKSESKIYLEAKTIKEMSAEVNESVRIAEIFFYVMFVLVAALIEYGIYSIYENN
ncbi:hypothetical protein ABRQ21_09650 [Latilactobacillus sakei]|uniref:hypothetical protein n=1 Tax=Latilactobacillus sakei TaxID=1599 RepID=UPI0035C78A42